MHYWKCDNCGKQTTINPPTEQVFDKDGKPEMVEMKNMDLQTGEVKLVKLPKLKDLAPRAHLIRLSLGTSQLIQRDFCDDCLNLSLPEIKALWNKLESFRSQ